MAPRRPPRREETSRSDDGATTRLVYSTGGETPASDPPRDARKPRPAPSKPPSPGGGGGVRLRLERRASGRMVTIIRGLPGTPAEVALLARELRTVCGAGGTARDREVELQGDQREKAAAALTARGLRVKVS